MSDDLRNDRVEQALQRAVSAGRSAELIAALERTSGGPSGGLALARAVGIELAGMGRRAGPLLGALLRDGSEPAAVVGAMTLAARWGRGLDERGASEALQRLAEDERGAVRAGVVEALRDVVRALGDRAVGDLSGWTDGYFQAHAVLAALADRTLLASLTAPAAVLARLDEAFELANRAGRAADRAPGVRALRRGLPAQVAVFAGRHHGVMAWLSGKLGAKRPETREVLEEILRALRKAGLAGAEVDRLAAVLAASARPPRDPTRIVAGTRRRSRGR